MNHLIRHTTGVRHPCPQHSPRAITCVFCSNHSFKLVHKIFLCVDFCEDFVFTDHGWLARKSSMVVPLRHTVEACNEAERMAEELSGRLAEQGKLNPTDLGFLCQSDGSVPSHFVQRCVVKTGEWPQHSVMQWHSKIRCAMGTCHCWHVSLPMVCPIQNVLIAYDRDLSEYRVTRTTSSIIHLAPLSCLASNTRTNYPGKTLMCAWEYKTFSVCVGSFGSSICSSCMWCCQPSSYDCKVLYFSLMSHMRKLELVFFVGVACSTLGAMPKISV